MGYSSHKKEKKKGVGYSTPKKERKKGRSKILGRACSVAVINNKQTEPKKPRGGNNSEGEDEVERKDRVNHGNQERTEQIMTQNRTESP